MTDEKNPSEGEAMTDENNPRGKKITDIIDCAMDHIEKNGYHGLSNPEMGCACTLPDIAVDCDGLQPDCEFGVMVTCDCGDHDYHIGKGKP